MITGETEGYKPLNQIRAKAEKDASYIQDERERQAQIEWSVLLGAGSEQLTQEHAIQCLEAQEADLRERVNRAMGKGREGEGMFHTYYYAWEEVYDALRGAKGKGDVSKTIGYFRKNAAFYEKLSDENSGVLSEGGPFDTNFILDAKTKKWQMEIWDKAAINLNTVARLFERDIENTLTQSSETPQ